MGDETTNLNLLGIAVSIILIVWCLLSSRKVVAIPFLVAGSWLTLGQRLVLFDLNFTLLRVLALIVLLRITLRQEWRLVSSHRVDRLVLWWTMVRIVSFSILWLSGEALLNRIGFALDALGMYYAFRLCARDFEDRMRLVKTMVLILMPVAICMVVERRVGYNYFSVFGGVPEWSFLRDGIIRSQGPYSHPILAGTVGAVWFPAFVGLWLSRRTSVWAAAGVIVSLCMVVTAGSSGPILAVGLSVVALMLWSFRRQMWMVRRAIVAGLIVLQLGLSEPIWFIFAKVNVLSASTGWHRAHLIDMAVKHFTEWVLVGIKDVAGWGVWAGDITNHYLLEGFRGGLITMWLFIAIIVKLYSEIGRAIKWEWVVPPAQRAMVWALGATLTGHVVSFFSVAYWESQSMLHWFLAIALIVGATQSVEGAKHIALAAEDESDSDDPLSRPNGVVADVRPAGVGV